MRKFFMIGAAVLTAGLLAGCGHNVIHYGDGIGFDASLSPEDYTLGLNLRYGKILSAVTRDNVEITMNGKADASGTTETSGSSGTDTSSSSTTTGTGTGTGSTTVGTDGSLTVKIGRQINGAAVDLVKAGADPEKVINALTKNDNKTSMPTENK